MGDVNYHQPKPKQDMPATATSATNQFKTLESGDLRDIGQRVESLEQMHLQQAQQLNFLRDSTTRIQQDMQQVVAMNLVSSNKFPFIILMHCYLFLPCPFITVLHL